MGRRKNLRYYLVTLDLQWRGCTQDLVDVTRVLREAEEWWNHQHNVWVVGAEDIKPLFDRLATYAESILFLIVEIPKDTHMVGFLPADAWDWLKQRGLYKEATEGIRGPA